MEKLSIITPVYNGEKYIKRYLSSVSEVKKAEIIFIDDCSTDNSYAMLKEFQKTHPSCKLLKNETNMGVSYSRNQGIKQASNKYILFLDIDDYLNDNFKNLANYLEFDYDFISFGVISKKNNNLIKNSIIFSGDMTKQTLLTKNLTAFFDVNVSTWIKNKLYKTSLIKNNNILFDQNISFAEDLKFNLDFINKSNHYYFCNDHFIVYDRDVPNSLSRQYESKNVTEYFKQRAYVEDFLKQNNIPLTKEYFFDCAGLFSYCVQKVLYCNSSINSKEKELSQIFNHDLSGLLPYLDLNSAFDIKLKQAIENKDLKYIFGE